MSPVMLAQTPYFQYFYIEIRLIRCYYTQLEDTSEGTFTSYYQGMYFFSEAGQRALQPEVMLPCFLSEDLHISPATSDKGFYNAL